MARNAEFDGSHGAQNSEKPKRFLEEQETRECLGHANQNHLLPLPLQMKPALMESKLAITLFAGLFVGAVVLLFVPPQFPVHGDNGELLWRIAKLVSCDIRLAARNMPRNEVCPLCRS